MNQEVTVTKHTSAILKLDCVVGVMKGENGEFVYLLRGDNLPGVAYEGDVLACDNGNWSINSSKRLEKQKDNCKSVIIPMRKLLNERYANVIQLKSNKEKMVFETLVLQVYGVVDGSVNGLDYDISLSKVMLNAYNDIFVPIIRPLIESQDNIMKELEKQMKYGTRVTVCNEEFEKILNNVING